MKSSSNHNPRGSNVANINTNSKPGSNVANINTNSKPASNPKTILFRRRGSRDLRISTLPGTEPGAQYRRPAPPNGNSTTVQPMNFTDTIPSIRIDSPTKPSNIVQVEVKEITDETEPPVNMPVYILPHSFISSTIPALTPADTTPPVENQIGTKPSEPLKGKGDIKVEEITREYMDKVLEEKARVEHDEETGGVETGKFKSLYEELCELKWNIGGGDSNMYIEGPRTGSRRSEVAAWLDERKRVGLEAAKASAKTNPERAALVEAVEKQRADALKKDTNAVLQTGDEESLSVEASDKIEKWKWVFYTGDKGGEIRTKIPLSPRGTPIHYG